MQFIETYKTSHYTQGINTMEYIVLHHTAQAKNATDLNVVKFLCNNKNQVSCHYVVSKTGEIYKISPDNAIAHHAGVSERDGKKYMNQYSIGIEICSDGYEYTDAQRNAVRQLVEYLSNLHKIDYTKVIRHKDVAPGRKRDVGDNFWNNKYKTYQDYQKSFAKISAGDILKQLGITNGENPQDPATREQVWIMMERLLNYLQSNKL